MEQINAIRPMNGYEIARWYEVELSEAFAIEEHKPLSDILALRREGRYELLGMFRDEALIAYAAVWTGPGIRSVLLDYLGVTASLRGGGIGARILAQLRERYAGRTVIVESELPEDGENEEENALRQRRIGFYMRNGFVPAYIMATCGHAWRALLSDPAPEPGSEAMNLVMAEHRALYGPGREDVKVPLLPGETPEKPYWMK